MKISPGCCINELSFHSPHTTMFKLCLFRGDEPREFVVRMLVLCRYTALKDIELVNKIKINIMIIMKRETLTPHLLLGLLSKMNSLFNNVRHVVPN